LTANVAVEQLQSRGQREQRGRLRVRVGAVADAWEQSDSFGRDDLPLVGKVADLAHTWMTSL
jgi:hypothetical protein